MSKWSKMTCSSKSICQPRPTAEDFRAQCRGGGLFTLAINQRAGARLAVAADRMAVPPKWLTLCNLFLGVSASTTLVLAAHSMASGRIHAAPVAAGAWLLWQLAYSLDCADGQLARVTGRCTASGGHLDVFCDAAVHVSVVAAVASVAVAYSPSTPVWLVSAFASCWMVNLIASVMAKDGAAISMVSSDSMFVQLAKLVRDYGAIITIIGAVLTFLPQRTVVVLSFFTACNLFFLLASIVHSSLADRPAARPSPAFPHHAQERHDSEPAVDQRPHTEPQLPSVP
jgi:phosphatidylglycerophosphate synthase